MNRLVASSCILLSLLTTMFMASLGHNMVQNHRRSDMGMTSTCFQLCITNAASRQIDVVKPASGILGVLLIGIALVVLYKVIADTSISVVFSHDPSPPDILSTTQRFRF